MFTGIVQAQCPVVGIDEHDGVTRLRIELGELAEGLQDGASVSHNGTCLTVAEISGGVMGADVISETLAVTNLGELVVGDMVNIERSLSFGDELGGHILSGHVSGTATISGIEVDERNRTVWFDIDPEHMPYLLMKGWVALNGASLTISRVDRDDNRIAVSLIPETLERTTFGRAQVGDRVNIEVDAQTQTIVHTVRQVMADPDFRRQLLEQIN